MKETLLYSLYDYMTDLGYDISLKCDGKNSGIVVSVIEDFLNTIIENSNWFDKEKHNLKVKEITEGYFIY